MNDRYADYRAFRINECDGPSFITAGEGNCLHTRVRPKAAPKEVPSSVTTEEIFSALKDILRRCHISSLCDELERVRINHSEDERIVLVAHPGGEVTICTEAECEDELEYWDEYTGIDIVFDEALLISFNEEDVVTLGGTRYIAGSIIVLEIDGDGNECSIHRETLTNFIDFWHTSFTEIEVDGETYGAFRMDD